MSYNVNSTSQYIRRAQAASAPARLTTAFLAGFALALLMTAATRAAEPLSLEEAISLARERNPAILGAAHARRSAELRKGVASAQRLPTARLLAGAQQSLYDQRLVPARKPNDPGVYSAAIASGDIVVSVPVYTGGRIAADEAAVEAVFEASRFQYDRTCALVTFSVSDLFFRILAQQQLVDAVEFSRRAIAEHRERLSLLVAEQKAARVDVLRLDARQADIEERYVRENNTLSLQRRELSNLLGLDGGEIEIVGDLTPPDSARCDLASLLDAAYAGRSDVRAQQAQVTAQEQRAIRAGSDRLPFLSLRGSYGVRATPGPDDAALDNVGSIGLMADFTLFDGRKTTYLQRAEYARLDVERAALEDLRRRVRLEVERAVLDCGAARERIRALTRSVALAQETFTIEREKHALGTGTVLDVLDAQASLLSAEAGFVRALADFRLSQARINLATERSR